MKLHRAFAAIALAFTLACTSVASSTADASTSHATTIGLKTVLDAPGIDQLQIRRSVMSAFFVSRPDAWSVKTPHGYFDLIVFSSSTPTRVEQRRAADPGRYVYRVSRGNHSRSIDANRRLYFVTRANALAVTDNAALATKLRAILHAN